IIDEYLLSLSEKKRPKALITENIANKYLQILNNSQDTHIANPNKPVALKERLYYIIAEEHLAIGHGDAKAIYKQVSDKYHDLIFGYEPHSNYVLLDQLWSQGIRDEENISNDVQIEEYYDVQFDNDNEDNIQVEEDEDDSINE
ncbi:8021_t:CDS:2, partial [Racocetra fulgida]